MKYKLTIEAEFEADSYVKALGVVSKAVAVVDEEGSVTVSKADFKEQHAPSVVIRDSGMRRYESGDAGGVAINQTSEVSDFGYK